MVSTAKPGTVPAQEIREDEAFLVTMDAYLAEVKRLLLEKDLRAEWVEELIERDRIWLEKAFEKKLPPVYGAFEIYITEEESAREAAPLDCRLKLDVTEQAKTYLQQLVKIGLWGDSIESVAATLIQQHLASKLEAGLFRLTANR